VNIIEELFNREIEDENDDLMPGETPKKLTPIGGVS